MSATLKVIIISFVKANDSHTCLYSIRSTVPVQHGTLTRLGLQGLTLLPLEISFSTQSLFLRANEKQMLHQEEESMAHTSWACQLNGLNNLFTLECQVQGLVLSMLCFAAGGRRVTKQDLTSHCHLTVNIFSSGKHLLLC